MRINNDDDDIAKDGETIRVPMYLADGQGSMLHDGMGNPAGHKRGYAFSSGGTTEMARRRAYDEYQHELGDAWRSNRPDEGQSGGDSRADYVKRLSTAWRISR